MSLALVWKPIDILFSLIDNSQTKQTDKGQVFSRQQRRTVFLCQLLVQDSRVRALVGSTQADIVEDCSKVFSKADVHLRSKCIVQEAIVS